MIPLSQAELDAAAHKLAHRERELRNHGWQRPPVITRHDIYDMRIDQWQMRQGIEPKETA